MTNLLSTSSLSAACDEAGAREGIAFRRPASMSFLHAQVVPSLPGLIQEADQPFWYKNVAELVSAATAVFLNVGGGRCRPQRNCAGRLVRIQVQEMEFRTT
jgi:hypothetical protein